MEDIPVGAGHLVDFRKLNAAAQEIIDEFRLPIRAGDRVKNLSVAYQQMVEIMKVCRRHPKIIAFDEPPPACPMQKSKPCLKLFSS